MKALLKVRAKELLQARRAKARLAAGPKSVPSPTAQLGRHLNDVKTDNRLGNLAWGTPQQNVDDAFRNGRTSNGERHPGAKLTAQDVLLIRQLAAEGEYHDSLATRFGVRQSRITRIVNRKAWRHVA